MENVLVRRAARRGSLIVGIFVALGLAVLTASCGDKKVKTGRIYDSAIEGLFWISEAMSGYTGAGGEFEFRRGDLVTFSFGAIIFGTAEADDTLTVVDLVDGGSVESDAVTNMARLLQTMDSDGDLDNGINLSAFARARAVTDLEFDQSPEDFENDVDVRTFVEAIDGEGAVLVSVQAARAHLEATIEALNLAAANAVPTARAGSDQNGLSEGTVVRLDGEGEDTDGTIVSYEWAQSSDDSVQVELAGAADLSPAAQVSGLVASFTVPTVPSGTTEFNFTLTVTDNEGGSGTDAIKITVVK